VYQCLGPAASQDTVTVLELLPHWHQAPPAHKEAILQRHNCEQPFLAALWLELHRSSPQEGSRTIRTQGMNRERHQPTSSANEEAVAERICKFIVKLKKLKHVAPSPLTKIVDDSSGHNFVEEPHTPLQKMMPSAHTLLLDFIVEIDAWAPGRDTRIGTRRGRPQRQNQEEQYSPWAPKSLSIWIPVYDRLQGTDISMEFPTLKFELGMAILRGNESGNPIQTEELSLARSWTMPLKEPATYRMSAPEGDAEMKVEHYKCTLD
ncbi:Zinc finger protein ZPR1, partial [Galemys pyrenaicus]